MRVLIVIVGIGIVSALIFSGCTILSTTVPTNATVETAIQPQCISECAKSTSSTCVTDCEAGIQYLIQFGQEKGQ